MPKELEAIVRPRLFVEMDAVELCMCSIKDKMVVQIWQISMAPAGYGQDSTPFDCRMIFEARK